MKAIFWDNDGVLVETEHLYYEATTQVLETIGIPFTREQYIELFLVQGRGAWHLAEAQGMGAGEVERLKARRNALYADFLRETPRIVPGVAGVLEQLHGRYRMGIVTSSHRDHFELIHRSTGLMKYFEFVLTAEDFRRSKPDPEPYLQAIGKSGCDPEDCIAIEDSERGLESATRAGIRCLVVPSGMTQGRRFAAAHRVLSSVTEIPEALRLGAG